MPRRLSNFAENETKMERTINEYYELISKILLENKVYMDPTLTFSRLCQYIGADPKALDTLVLSEMGLSGDELMRRYRAQEWERVRQQYGAEA